ncbi:hypothetical protein [Burkholderia multivorans]|uniref:hypothetical protein n=1 Tax=Burkholderia multivorans TaxID=87883 RepID=UPI001C26559C|nr:hypothetical protein [Burkholderia multivorans]MBU9576673.1 hypothetical protein [Burkholderia multivorans]MDN7953870.1 hypothetical protein [Burkholderia multivorans]
MKNTTEAIDSVLLSRDQKLTLIYRHTHRDYKGKAGAVWGSEHVGKRTLVVNRAGASILVLLENLSDAEISDRLPYALKKEANRLAGKEARV